MLLCIAECAFCGSWSNHVFLIENSTALKVDKLVEEDMDVLVTNSCVSQ